MYKKGDLVKVIANICGHGYLVGGIYIIYKLREGDDGICYLKDARTGVEGGSYVKEGDIIPAFRLKSEKVKWMTENSLLIFKAIENELQNICDSMVHNKAEENRLLEKKKELQVRKKETKNFFRHLDMKNHQGETREEEIAEVISKILACKQSNEVKKGKIYRVLKEHSLIVTSPY